MKKRPATIYERSTREMQRICSGISRLDAQTFVVLVTTPLLVFLQFWIGNRRRFLEVVHQYIPDAYEGLAAWSWWFGFQGIVGMGVPLLILMVLFRRRAGEIGLGVGDWRFGLTIGALYLPVVLIGTWILSDSAAYQRSYPHLDLAARDWRVFAIYHAMFLLYWIGWEYLWRGYVLFGTARTFGIYAILIQAVPFATLHVNKPPSEAFLSILGGIALGALVWRCRSFWYAVPIHAIQMIAIDFWCTLRIRTGVSGKGLSALSRLIDQL